MKFKKGISLIVLVITIIVIIILSGAVILLLSQNNPIEHANIAKFKSDAQEINSELSLWISKQYLNMQNTFDFNNINVDNLNKTYNGQNISQILTTLKPNYLNKFQIVSGKLTYVGTDIDELKSATDIGLNVELPYVKDRLDIWYDGVNNGGFGIHNDNTSISRTIWQDLSGNNNNASLTNFKYTNNSGWLTSGLKFDGLSNYLILSNLNKYNSDFTIKINSISPSIITTQMLYGVNRGSASIFFIFYRATGYITIGCDVNKTLRWEIVKYDVNKNYDINIKRENNQITAIINNVVYVPDSVTNNDFISMLNGVISTDSFTLGAYSSTTSLLFNNKMNNFMQYSRALTTLEIQQNYDLDKIRFGI
jgi:Tfp pilus assembly protein PilE